MNGRFWANVAIGLPSPLVHYSVRPMRFTINVITQEGLYQNKVNSSLVSTYNCKMDYFPESAKSKRGKRQIVSRQLQMCEEQCMEICSNKIGNFSLLPRQSIRSVVINNLLLFYCKTGTLLSIPFWRITSSHRNGELTHKYRVWSNGCKMNPYQL